VASIGAGHSWYIYGGGRYARIHPTRCGRYGLTPYITTDPVATTLNNLDNLPTASGLNAHRHLGSERSLAPRGARGRRQHPLDRRLLLLRPTKLAKPFGVAYLLDINPPY
jgi:hypothetical protein